jgi:hypothetical protein
LERARARRDHRDDTIAALRFQLAELGRSAHDRSVAAASAFVFNPANQLSPAPPHPGPSASPSPVDLGRDEPELGAATTLASPPDLAARSSPADFRRSSSVSPIPPDLEPAAPPSPLLARPRIRLLLGSGLRFGAASAAGPVRRLAPGLPPWALD